MGKRTLVWDSLCTNTKFNDTNICRHVYATGHGGSYTASIWFSILVSVPKMWCNLFAFPRTRVFWEFPSKRCLYDWTAIGHMLAKRNSPWLGGSLDWWPKKPAADSSRHGISWGISKRQCLSLLTFHATAVMDISRLPCKENPPTTPLYRTHRGEESHNESC